MTSDVRNPEQLERRYRRDGFVSFSVFSPTEIAAIRDDIYGCFRRRHGGIGESDARDLTSRDLLAAPRTLAAVVHPAITRVLKALLGTDCVYLPDFEVHINQYGIGKGGWHLDCGSEIPNPYLLEPRYRFVKCGIFLQDNSPDLAGGIDVLRGLHRGFPPIGSVMNRFRAQYLMTKLLQAIYHYRVPTRAGDVIVFDSRLPHRGTAPNAEFLSTVSEAQLSRNNFSGAIPAGRDKMVIYFDACRSSYANAFLANSVRRARDELELPMSSQYRAQYLGIRYPEDFPAEIRSLFDAAGIRFATYEGEEKSYWIGHWQKHLKAEMGEREYV
jgi:hypothetical protein